MNKHQKNIIIDSAVVITVTAVAVVAMINFKDYVNWSESMQAINQLSQIVLKYRKTYGAIPPESYINDITEDLPGKARLGKIMYRAAWIDFGASSDEILAYVKKSYHSFIMHDGYIVLKLDGRVEWVEPKRFEELLAKQQKPMEKELFQK